MVAVAFPPLSVAVNVTEVMPCLAVTFTVPVGVPEVDDFTVTVKVTELPKVEGFNEEVSNVEVAAGFTI